MRLHDLFDYYVRERPDSEFAVMGGGGLSPKPRLARRSTAWPMPLPVPVSRGETGSLYCPKTASNTSSCITRAPGPEWSRYL